MTTYAFQLAIEVEAHNEEQALEIANDAKRHLIDASHPFPWKVTDIEINNLEEL